MDFMHGYDPLIDTIDILLVAVLVYRVLLIVRGTRSVQVLSGFGLLFGGFVLIEFFELNTSTWILRNAFRELPLIILILFQQDIRVALARLGRGRWANAAGIQDSQVMIEEVIHAMEILTRSRTGAIIVFERKSGLVDFAERGIELDGKIHTETLVGLFQHTNPLHDGAVIIRDARIASASVILPLTDTAVPSYFGTRHRAAMGITQISDAVALTVSEERGEISLFVDGGFEENLESDTLRSRLYKLLGVAQKKSSS